MANGAFNFDMDAVGRRAADLCLMDIQKNFNGQICVQNGPWVILRVLQTLCGTNRVSVRPVNKCFNPLARKFAFSYRTHFSVSCHDHNWQRYSQAGLYKQRRDVFTARYELNLYTPSGPIIAPLGEGKCTELS